MTCTTHARTAIIRSSAIDRSHRARSRPVAPGWPRLGALTAGLGLAAWLGVATLGVAAAYAGLNFAYTGWLRRVAVADIAAIAAAFVLRAAAGGVAAGVPISRWLFVVVSFSALFVAAGKRYADWLDPAARGSRRVLSDYNPDFLRLVLGASSAVALGAYCLWAFRPGQPGAMVWREATIAPFTLALLRYGLLVTGGKGGAPEEIMLTDRFIQLSGLAWLMTFVLGL